MHSASKVVLLSINSLLLIGPVCEVLVIDKRNISHYFSYWDLLDDPLLSLGYSHKADYLRLYLLNNCGGFRVDAPVFCW